MKPVARILVVDDDLPARELLSQALITRGFEILQASTGQQALELARAECPEVIVLALPLPDLAVSQICTRIKQDAALQDTPVILCTAEPLAGSLALQQAAGPADGYLTRPLDPQHLLVRIQTLLRQRQARIALRATEGLYRQLVKLLPCGVALVDLEGRPLAVNPEAVKFSGYETEAELLQKSVFDFAHPEEHARLRANIAGILHTNLPRSVEYRAVKKDGTHFWVEVNAAIIAPEPGGQPVGLLLIIRDITERKRIDQELEQARHLQQVAWNNLHDLAWLKDIQGRFLICNDALASFHGHSVPGLLGKSVIDLGVPEADALTREDEEVLRSGKMARFETQVSDAQGRLKWFETFKSPVLDERGKLFGLVGIARDITERKRLEEELRQLPRRIIEAQETERMRVARELHDSVNQLLASAQMRLRKVEQIVAASQPAGREILARSRDLLVQALEENRRIAHGLRPRDLDALGLPSACHNFCKQFRSRTGLAIRCRITRLARRLDPAVELNLFRIIQEAFTNTEKHARATRVDLGISRQAGLLRLKIHDDGRGFDPNPPRKAGRRRQGLGLANIRGRAAALGGTCEFKSSRAEGTTVTVTIPWPAGR